MVTSTAVVMSVVMSSLIFSQISTVALAFAMFKYISKLCYEFNLEADVPCKIAKIESMQAYIYMGDSLSYIDLLLSCLHHLPVIHRVLSINYTRLYAVLLPHDNSLLILSDFHANFIH